MKAARVTGITGQDESYLAELLLSNGYVAHTAEVDAVGTLRLLEAVRDLQEHHGRAIRFYNAGSSESGMELARRDRLLADHGQAPVVRGGAAP